MKYSDWEITKWGDIAVLNYGKGLKGYKEKSIGYPVYGTNGQIGYNDIYLSAEEGVIVGRKGAFRGVHYSSLPFFVIDTAYYLGIKDKKQLDIKWAYYALLNIDINRLDSGSAIPSLSRQDFYSQRVYLPSVNEQKKIADILISIDKKIEINNQINKTLESIAQSIFQHWFVDFEFPNENGEPYQSSGGEMTRSEFGLIPKGSLIKNLADISNAISGYSYKGIDLAPSDDALLTIKNFNKDGSFKVEGFKEINISDRVKHKHYAKEFDIIVAHTDLTQNATIIGNPILVLFDGGYNNIVYSMDTVKVVPFQESSKFYVYELLKTRAFKQYAISYTSGTTVLHLSKKALPKYSFVILEDGVIEKFNDIVKPMFYKIKNNIDEATKLKAIRDLLLPKLMSGEIRVPVSEDEVVLTLE